MTSKKINWKRVMELFQYRKRYEVTCDASKREKKECKRLWFQYRKRYEVTCDFNPTKYSMEKALFQYRKRYEVTCDGNHGKS